jgi:signal transduction histidine kinase
VEALQLAEQTKYDVIVSDILMPRMDGFELCRELKRREPLKDIPFIFCTATYTDAKDMAFALSLGADRFLAKPIETDELLKAIEEVIAAPQHATPTQDLEEESIYLKEYNARLIAKLEKKMLDLEQANRELEADIAERERAQEERAKLERQLRQAQKMEAIGTLAGGIAHDFNNILAGIVGFADLARQDADHTTAVRQHLDEILKASMRAKELVRQILAFSRQQEQSRQPMKIQATLDEALSLLRASIPRSIAINADLDPKAPTVLADATQVHQVITNLATNAWHAIGDRAGRIDVVVRPFEVDEDIARINPDLRPGRYVRLSVTDDGPGIPADKIERIFEPFFTTKEPGHGSGLGLAVVHGIVKASDGAITVYSELQRGTTFHVYLPAIELDAPPVEPISRGLLKGDGERILFIDDERILLTLGERFLSRLGYAPVCEHDPVAAIQRFTLGNFTAVITDLTMPQMSGLDVGRRLLQIKPGLPIILSTGYSATMDADRIRALGFADLLIKPYSIEALGIALHRALKKGGQLASVQGEPPRNQ